MVSDFLLKPLKPALALGAMVMILGQSGHAIAKPAPIFDPHIKEIRENLPPGWVFRLPPQIFLKKSPVAVEQLVVKVFPSNTPPGMTVGLFSCEQGLLPCFVGSFSVDRDSSPNAQRAFKLHQAAAAPIKLTQGIRGYLLAGPLQRPYRNFSSVMWQQDGMLYTVTMPDSERQNLLYTAYYITADNALYSLAGAPQPYWKNPAAVPPKK